MFIFSGTLVICIDGTICCLQDVLIHWNLRMVYNKRIIHRETFQNVYTVTQNYNETVKLPGILLFREGILSLSHTESSEMSLVRPRSSGIRIV